MQRSIFAAVLAFVIAPGLAHAQGYAVDKGSVNVGGTASFTSSKATTADVAQPRLTTLGLAPHLLFFLAPGIAVGGEASLGRTSSDGNSTTQYGLGPAIEYYFGHEERNWYPFVGASVRFSHVSGDGQLGSDFRDLRASAGLLFLLSPSVGVNSELYLSRTHTTFESPATLEELDSNTTAFGLAIGISAFVF
jgi:hypothetical protein